MTLHQLAQACTRLRDHSDRNPLHHIRWLPGQYAFLSDPSPRKLFRAGNQSQGKTTAGLAGVIWRCLGDHPYLQVNPPPIEAWVVCASWSQSLAIQGKLWAMVPKDRVHPGTEYDAVKGLRGVNPALRFDNGSIIRIKTTQQGIALSGATIDVALFDEPPKNARVFGEVQKRVMRAGKRGLCALTLTPVNAPTDWLREACEAGIVTDHHFRLERQNLIPVGYHEPLVLADGTVCDQRWIDAIIAESMPHEVPVVVHGDWEMKSVGAVFSDFRDDKHISTDGPRGQVKLAVGLDHGDGAEFSQMGILIAVDETGEWPRVWVLDEYTSESTTTVDMDASALRVMLQRHGLDWSSLDYAWGDRYYPGRRGGASKKSNLDLMHALARELRISQTRLRPSIRTVKRGRNRGAGSVHRGLRFIHYAMVRPGHFRVHPRCQRLIDSIKRYDLRDNQHKHAIDSLRYALTTWIFQNRRQQSQAVRLGV